MIEIRDRIAGPFAPLDGIPVTVADPELGAISVPNVLTVGGAMAIDSGPFDELANAASARVSNARTRAPGVRLGASRRYGPASGNRREPAIRDVGGGPEGGNAGRRPARLGPNRWRPAGWVRR